MVPKVAVMERFAGRYRTSILPAARWASHSPKASLSPVGSVGEPSIGRLAITVGDGSG